jgi:hypothetical protein
MESAFSSRYKTTPLGAAMYTEDQRYTLKSSILQDIKPCNPFENMFL